MLSFHVAKRGIGIDQVRHTGQRGQSGKSDPRRLIAAGDALMRSLPVVMGGICFRHLADLIQRLGTRELQAFLIERAMISFDKPILLWVMRITNEYGDSQGVAEAHESGRKVTALGRAYPARIPVQRDGGR